MEKTIISTTSPNSEGEMLWCVHFASSYYDNDPRMPGAVPVGARFYVLAKSKDEAINKVQAEIEKTRERCDEGVEEKITASIVTLEDFIPCRDSSGEGRMGFYSLAKYAKVALSCPEDTSRYQLAVCLVPVKTNE